MSDKIMIAVKIDVKKINKARLFQGKNGALYLDLILMESSNDQYGNDFMVVESTKKEEREAGVKGNILGNAKYIGKRPPETIPANYPTSDPKTVDTMDDLPF